VNPDLKRELGRWIDADRSGRDDEADAAFGGVFRAVPQPSLQPGLPDRVIEALAREAADRARRAKTAAAAALAAGLALLALAGVFLVSRGPRLFFDAVDLGVRGAVWTSESFERGLGLWAILGQIGRVMTAVIATPQVTVALVGIGMVGALALYGLQRVLSSEQESS
jgi:hypothetical protein